ncbi:hypothetical protein EDC94DRAFT_598717, partial [Helicostylum pulchrum]
VLGGDDSRLSLLPLVKIETQKPVKGEEYGILLPDEKNEDDCAVRFTRLQMYTGVSLMTKYGGLAICTGYLNGTATYTAK